MDLVLLLVHGGSHGAWCWDDVVSLLEARGLRTRTLDLPGSGADQTPRASLGLADSAAAIVAAVDETAAGPIVLVGHSIGGMPLPTVAAQRSDRVSGLVFVAAVVLRTGERGIDMIPADRRPGYFAMADASGENSLLPGFADAWDRFFPSLGEERAREMYARLTPQPLGPYLDPAVVGIDKVDCPRSYVLIEGDRTFPPAVAAGFAQRAEVTPVQVAGDHCLMLTDAPAMAESLEVVATQMRR